VLEKTERKTRESEAIIKMSSSFLLEKEKGVLVLGAAPTTQEVFTREQQDGDALFVLGGSPFPFTDRQVQHCCCSASGVEALLTCGLCNMCMEDGDERGMILRDWVFSMCFPEFSVGLALHRMDRRKALACFVCSLGLRAMAGQFCGCMLDAGAMQGVAQGVDFACNEQVCQLAAAATASCCGSLCASTYTAYDVNVWAQERTGSSESNFCKYCVGLHLFQPCFGYTALRASRKASAVPVAVVPLEGAPRQCNCE
jgi:hypothetical protein